LPSQTLKERLHPGIDEWRHDEHLVDGNLWWVPVVIRPRV
jgi:hypothetical protein